MDGTFFALDHTALGILALGLLLASLIKIFFFPSSLPPHFLFSDVKTLLYPNQRSRLAHLPKRLHQLALACFMLAFADPHFLFPKSRQPPPHPFVRTEIPTKGIAIYLLLDQSSSMAETISSFKRNKTQPAPSKFYLLKQLTKQFILSRPSDLIGLISFARVPKVIVPLTLDQESLIDHLNQLEVVQNPEEDGTAIGYAIFKTVSLIAATRHFAEELQGKEKAAYEIKHAIIIVVTDGFQDPNRLDYGNRLRTIELDEGAAYAKSQGVRLYVINIDPHFSSSPEFAPHRRQIKALTESTGGQFYAVNKSEDLEQIYNTIDRIEKEDIPIVLNPKENLKAAYNRFSLYPFLVSAGMFFFLSAAFLETTFLKKIP
ncbi:vWA domain-containing protein [Candidatus Protochlamydia phocaeensis]|uniref:vWA domain-containing protein n=1 Tax=Candidatus Protochlamydia phocaeensis TaxID=1414722 RepID=UPI0008396A9B|nr:VWA domain-containing protein [Candidatus Protochlamydia phocaeensis]